jgi:hypothetical protein
MLTRTSHLLGIVVIALSTGAGLLRAQAPASCPEGRELSGDLGIEQLICSGSACAVSLRDDAGYYHDFSVEPRIGRLRSGTPPADALRDGDVIVAIDDVPITTREGGRRMANLTVGRPVTLTIRRDGQLLSVEVHPVPGCNMPGLRVRARVPAGTLRETRRSG